MTFDLVLQGLWFALVLLACWGYAKWLFGDAPYPLPTGFCIFAIIFTGLRWAHLEAAPATVCFGIFCIGGWAIAIRCLIRTSAEGFSLTKQLAAFVSIHTAGYLIPDSAFVDAKHYAMDMAWFFSPEWATKQATLMSTFAPTVWDLGSLTRPAATLLGWTSNLISVSIDEGLTFRLDLVLLVYLGYLVWAYLSPAKTAVRVAAVAVAISGSLIFSALYFGQVAQAFGSLFLLLIFLLVQQFPSDKQVSPLIQISLVSCAFVLSYPEMCLLLPFAAGAGLLARAGATNSRVAGMTLSGIALGAGLPLVLRLPRYEWYVAHQANVAVTGQPFKEFTKNPAYYWGVILAGVENGYVIDAMLVAIACSWAIRLAVLDRGGRLRLGLGILWFAAYGAVTLFFINRAMLPSYVLFKLACWVAPLLPLVLHLTLSDSRQVRPKLRSALEWSMVGVFLMIAGVSVYETFGRLGAIAANGRQPPVVLVKKAEMQQVKLADNDAAFYGLEWARMLFPYHNAPVSLVEKPKWGRVYAFTSAGNAKEIEVAGWASPEQWQTWTGSDRALLRIPLPPVQADVYLGMGCNVYVNPPVLPLQKVLIRANGEEVDDFETRTYFRRIVKIPQSLAAQRKNLDVSFLLPDATKAPDGRELAIGCNYMILNQGTPPTLW